MGQPGLVSWRQRGSAIWEGITLATRFRLRELVHKLGISQSELSRRSGVAFATINRLCTNATERVDLATLDRLSEALGCEPGELVERVPARARSRRT